MQGAPSGSLLHFAGKSCGDGPRVVTLQPPVDALLKLALEVLVVGGHECPAHLAAGVHVALLNAAMARCAHRAQVGDVVVAAVRAGEDVVELRPGSQPAHPAEQALAGEPDTEPTPLIQAGAITLGGTGVRSACHALPSPTVPGQAQPRPASTAEPSLTRPRPHQALPGRTSPCLGWHTPQRLDGPDHA